MNIKHKNFGMAERVGFEPTKTVLLECLPYAGLAQAQGGQAREFPG